MKEGSSPELFVCLFGFLFFCFAIIVIFGKNYFLNNIVFNKHKISHLTRIALFLKDII